MSTGFPAAMAALRRERGLSQRKAAADLGISQGQLSNFENGAREPGPDFICRACDYYGVTADFLLGRAGRSGEESEARRSRQASIEMCLSLLTETMKSLAAECAALEEEFKR